MNIYLDIDGVLLTKHGEPAPHIEEFLKHIIENHNVFWLTTHCKGDAEPTLIHLKRKLPLNVYQYIEHIRPTMWDVLKTDGIDFSKDFRWYDDSPMHSELLVLRKHDSENKLLLIDLNTNPNQLIDSLLLIK